ncbi:caspase-1-like [Apis florea]|uniref:caspase-1-like n=1 Tax=Apis florea TaxID=7463 RepID=UPI0012FF3778|nr:caspase-1-like [Apis florea]
MHYRIDVKLIIPKDCPVYSMKRKNRGKCVVFSHKKFPDINLYRNETVYDENAIRETFSALGFEVVIHKDLYFIDIIHIIDKLKDEDHSDSDCICFFVLTHGDSKGAIYASDGSFYSINIIWQLFTADSCPSLAGKPKLFFVQACKGSEGDEGIEGTEDTYTDSNEPSFIIPTRADFLYCFSTSEGYYAFRENNGSWYIQTLCRVINEYWQHCDMIKMLTITSRIVATEYLSQHNNSSKNEKKQMPFFVSTLIRNLYFT